MVARWLSCSQCNIPSSFKNRNLLIIRYIVHDAIFPVLLRIGICGKSRAIYSGVQTLVSLVLDLYVF